MRPASYQPEKKGAGWHLWEENASARPELGRPSAFDNRPDQSKWVSFTGTLREPTFFRIEGLHRQCPRRRRPCHLCRFRLASVDLAAPAAALYRPARRYRYLLGVRPVHRQPRRLREKADGSLHRAGDHGRGSGTSRRTGSGKRGSGERNRSSAHDALCHERVPDAARPETARM